MSQAICTPTKTRAEFESILMELDGVGVKWVGGQEPMVNADFYCGRFGHLFYMIAGDPTLTYGDNQCFPDVPVLPRTDFIAAIKRDFKKCEHIWYEHKLKGSICLECGIQEPKEQPKMKIYTDITPDALVIISESLEEKSTVKWCSGDKPTTRTNLGLDTHLAFNYGNTRALSHGLSKTYDGSLEWVTNKEFINLVTRELPKEKPKMNYDKMLKRDLITELKKRDAAIKSMNTHGEHIAKELTNQAEKTRSALQSLEMANVWVNKYDALEKTNNEFRAKWTEQDRQLNDALNDRDTMRGIANDMNYRYTELEKANAEQANLMEDMRKGFDVMEGAVEMAQDERDKANSALRLANAKLEKQTASISKFFADVLEGK